MGFFIQDALASTDTIASTIGTTSTTGDGTFSIIMMVAMIVIFYLLLWRPQSKRAKEHRNLVDNLKKGDEVVTSGGILGTIVDVEEKMLIVTIAEGVQIQLQRAAISSVLPKGSLK